MKIIIEESVLRQALDALEAVSYVIDPSRDPKEENLVMYAITALRTALDAAEKVEPVGHVVEWIDGSLIHAWLGEPPPKGTPLYTHPAPTVPDKTEAVQLRAELEAVKKERDALVNALDQEMVVCHLGVFSKGDDPVKAVKALMLWAQDVGEYFIKDELTTCQQQRDELAKLLSSVRVAMANDMADPYIMIGCDWTPKIAAIDVALAKVGAAIKQSEFGDEINTPEELL